MPDTLDPALEAALDPKARDKGIDAIDSLIWEKASKGLSAGLDEMFDAGIAAYLAAAAPQAEIDRLREALRPFGQMLIYSVEEDPALYVAFDKRTLAQLDPNSPEGAAALKLEAALSHARAILSEVAR